MPFFVVVFLFIVLTLSTLGIGLLLQDDQVILQYDRWLYHAIHNGFHHPLIDALTVPFNYNVIFHLPGDMPTFYYFMIVGVAIYLYRKDRRQAGWFLLCILLGNILVHIITGLAREIAFRERPFLTLPNAIDPYGYEAWKSLSSYPSGHARDTALYSTIIAIYVPKLKWPAVILIAFIAYSRVYLGAHYPSDVLVGIIIGFFTALIAKRFLEEVIIFQPILAKLWARWKS